MFLYETIDDSYTIKLYNWTRKGGNVGSLFPFDYNGVQDCLQMQPLIKCLFYMPKSFFEPKIV